MLSTIAFGLFFFVGRSIVAQNVGDRHMVAFRCHWPSMHLTDEGEWASDNTTDCLLSPDDILNYCKKVYPASDVRNIVELDRTVTVRNWCEFDGKTCSETFHVQPFQCLIGSFVASDLSVPDRCISDRIIDSRKCEDLRGWKSSAVRSCDRSHLRIEEISVLDPCDVGQFSGIQFVCCPINEGSIKAANNQSTLIDEVRSTADPSPAATEIVADGKPENEHRRYLRAKAELHKQRDEEISKIMDAWDEAQQEVRRMRLRDPETADKLERKMTARFQKTISSLEEREEEERHRIDSDHERNVQLEMNKRKRKAMEDYMEILSRQPQASMKDVLQVLRHYVRVEEKDRTHVINHFLHLRETDASAAESIRALVAERLRTIKLRLKRAMEMLGRVKEYESNVAQKIQDVIEEYEGFDELEASIVNADHSKSEAKTKNSDERIQETESVPSQNDSSETIAGEKEIATEDFKDTEDEKLSDLENSDLGTSDVLVEMNPAVQPGHVGSSQLRVEEKKSFKLNREESSSSVGPLVLVVATSVFLVTVTVLGVVVWRRYVETRRIQSRPRDDSLLLVSPDQTRVARMQANGYENPTYRYFETTATK